MKRTKFDSVADYQRYCERCAARKARPRKPKTALQRALAVRAAKVRELTAKARSTGRAVRLETRPARARAPNEQQPVPNKQSRMLDRAYSGQPLLHRRGRMA